MWNITTCKVKNEVNKQQIILNAEWTDENLKILIIEYGALPLAGEVTIAKLVEVADNFNRTKEEFLVEIKQELAGENPDIQFLLKDNTFVWRRKIWTRGRITCEPITEVLNLSNSVMNIINQNSIANEEVTKTQKENIKLKEKIKQMEDIMNKMTGKKNLLEEELYKRFLILLNSKKKRIRALQHQLHEYTKDTIYDKSTDESDEEVIYGDSQASKCSKINVILSSCEASVSNSINPVDAHYTVEDFHESDESFELKFEESQQYSQNNLNIFDKDSEKDIFSS